MKFNTNNSLNVPSYAEEVSLIYGVQVGRENNDMSENEMLFSQWLSEDFPEDYYDEEKNTIFSVLILDYSNETFFELTIDDIYNDIYQSILKVRERHPETMYSEDGLVSVTFKSDDEEGDIQIAINLEIFIEYDEGFPRNNVENLLDEKTKKEVLREVEDMLSEYLIMKQVNNILNGDSDE